MKNDLNRQKKIQRDERIDQLGGFGAKRTMAIPDKKKYNRKSKHKKSPRDDSGAFHLLKKYNYLTIELK